MYTYTYVYLYTYKELNIFRPPADVLPLYKTVWPPQGSQSLIGNDISSQAAAPLKRRRLIKNLQDCDWFPFCTGSMIGWVYDPDLISFPLSTELPHWWLSHRCPFPPRGSLFPTVTANISPYTVPSQMEKSKERWTNIKAASSPVKNDCSPNKRS